MPPVGMPRPACRRSRTSRLVPARRFWFESAELRRRWLMLSASLNVVIAAPAHQMIERADEQLGSVKPSSRDVERMAGPHE